jgi:hypothetical protein
VKLFGNLLVKGLFGLNGSPHSQRNLNQDESGRVLDAKI